MRLVKEDKDKAQNEYEIYKKESEEFTGKTYRISDEIIHPKLESLEKIYGVCDALSIKNADKTRSIILYLSILGTLLTLVFLLYDEAELHLLIIICIVNIILLDYFQRQANKLECHRKYLQYRVLTETVRVQFYLSASGISKPATSILPWFSEKAIPWINKVIVSPPVLLQNEKISILDFWVLNQKEYHYNKLLEEKEKLKHDRRIAKIVLGVTIATYIIALIFELYVLFYNVNEINLNVLGEILNMLQNNGIMIGYTQMDMIRSILKIVIGTMSAATLFTGSYYKKISLSDSIENHRRMIHLYVEAEEKIGNHPKNDEMILDLAKEYLIENSIWYAYQNQNRPEIVY